MIFFLLLLQNLFACTLDLQVDGMIGVGTYDYLVRAEEKAKEKGCSSYLFKINTPGGDLQSTRKIVTLMMNSTKPFLCLVYPSGGHAGSAGAIILQACHISGAMRATNIGAATPVQATGQEMPEDLRKKILNDTISWLEGITKARGRNLEFSKEIITEAKSVSGDEAASLGAIEISVVNVQEFLDFAKGREVSMDEDRKLEVVIGDLLKYDTDLRYHALQLVADPQIAYFLFLGSLGLLYFEFTNPGAILPGTIGALGLVLSFVAFHKLEVEWGGLALIFLGIFFFILEAFVPSFGILGLGGIIAFTLGGIFLYDESSAYHIPLYVILTSSILMGILLFLIAGLAYKSHGLKKKAGVEDLEGSIGEIIFLNEDKKSGHVLWKGERWQFQSEDPLDLKEKVRILNRNGFTFIVEKA